MTHDEMKKVLEALEYMHKEKADYMTRNRLGDPTKETAYGLYCAALSTLRAAMDAKEGEPVGFVSGRPDWSRHQSEQIVKITAGPQPEYGYTVPLYTHPAPAAPKGELPEGFRLLPIQATDAMMDAEWDVSMSEAHSNGGVSAAAWRAMVEAAPQVTYGDGYSGVGWYMHDTDYPEEGAVFLCGVAASHAADKQGDAQRLWRAENAIRNIETACNYSPHREAGTWDAALAALIHQSARLLPAMSTEGKKG